MSYVEALLVALLATESGHGETSGRSHVVDAVVFSFAFAFAFVVVAVGVCFAL